MKPAAFSYDRPRSVDEAVSLLAKHEDAKILAGGQSLVPLMSMRLARPAAIVDINGIDELRTMRSSGGYVHIGAAVRQSEAARSGVPLIVRALPYVGHWQTRNRGTVCGSLAHADPSAELAVVAVALQAQIEARSPRGTRRIAADAFFASLFTTALEPDEMVTAASFSQALPGWGFAFEEFAERHGDFAIVATACAASVARDGSIVSLRLALGGVSDRPVVCETADAIGRRLTATDAEELCAREAAKLDPPSDRRGSAAYRRRLACAQMQRALLGALEEGCMTCASS
jgi:carbon-monoxide dehydrogenase medium subunit